MTQALIFALRNLPGYVDGVRLIDDEAHLVPPDTVVLNLEGSALTDEGVQRLPALVELRSLDLDSTNITDKSLATLKRFPRLEELWLECTRVSDVGLIELHACKRLRFVSLAYTDVTDVAVEQLKAAAPGIEVSR